MVRKHLNRGFYRKVVSIALCVTMLSGMFFYHDMDVNAKTDLTLDDYREEAGTYSVTGDVPGYTEYMNTYEQVFPEDVIEIDAVDFCRYEDRDGTAKPDVYSDYEGMEGDSVLTTESALIEYDFEVATSGYYDLSLLYYPVEGKSSEIQRSFFIDGELPYGELSLIEFSRVWTTSVYDYYVNADDIEVARWPKDNQGNDLKPTAIEVPEWIESYLFDSNGYITDELKVYLEAGSHTLSIMSLREPMLIRKIIFNNSEDPESYAVVKANWDAMGAVQTTDQNIRIEAENAVKTSSQMLYPKQDQSSPAVYPSSARELLNNSIGGTNWQNAGQWIEWEFEVPETGYYNISMYDKQNFVRGIYVSRKIMIDGEIPFAEMSDYGFKYAQNWRLDVLSDDEGTPYQFYLEKGTHTLRMEVVLGDFSEIISTVQDSVQDLNAIYRKVIRIIGVSPDKYRDYQIAASLPELQGELEEVRAKLDSAIVELQAIAGSNTDKTTVLITMRDQLDELIYDQERFTEVITSYKINVRACGNWITQVVGQPLQVDRIYVYSDSSELKVAGASWFSRLIYELKRLFYSFIIDYNQIGNIADSNTEGTTITLWVGTGRDQANVIKNLIDESFTSTTNINVNVQLVDMSTLLKASLAGEGPDVALQVGPTQVATAVSAGAGASNASMVSASNDTPVNYGIRNAVLDLTQFEDYDEVVSRFSESSLVPFTYNGATYALPDTQTFLMMFYRKDILQEIGLEVPRTWDDVKVAMTVLSKNQMEFGMLPGEQVFAMLLFQNGGTYYSHEGMASALDEDVAVNTFKEYCEFYTDYKLDKETSVEERFRTGECPIIIADYTVFNNLAVSAPDIEGLWDFTVVPGIMQEDGTINHTTGSIGVADMIMADTEYPEESWEFLKWWTSAETQTLYGREMESLMGAAGRVATANIEALGNLSWQVDAYEALMEQFEQVQGIPQVPGGYYTWRNVNNAFYSVTTDTNTATPREALMEKVEYINAEIDYKREELGLPILED
ncbi:MAG: extracellular solute-binding protein [Lachnospiraceae bacterium]|nr:extracellular solute-binding protein [Lachnospiraceae bacterium]